MHIQRIHSIRIRIVTVSNWHRPAHPLSQSLQVTHPWVITTIYLSLQFTVVCIHTYVRTSSTTSIRMLVVCTGSSYYSDVCLIVHVFSVVVCIIGGYSNTSTRILVVSCVLGHCMHRKSTKYRVYGISIHLCIQDYCVAIYKKTIRTLSVQRSSRFTRPCIRRL